LKRIAAFIAAIALPAWAQDDAALQLFAAPAKGHCAACHQLPEGIGAASRNDVGPRLEGTRMRLLGKDGLREILKDPAVRNPDTVMPPYGRHRLLDAREIERLVEFLHALP
jgi:sulfur-oxidizing protein SoxX